MNSLVRLGLALALASVGLLTRTEVATGFAGDSVQNCGSLGSDVLALRMPRNAATPGFADVTPATAALHLQRRQGSCENARGSRVLELALALGLIAAFAVAYLSVPFLAALAVALMLACEVFLILSLVFVGPAVPVGLAVAGGPLLCIGVWGDRRLPASNPR